MSKTFNYAKSVGSPKNQANPIPGKQMVQNSCGAYVFALDKFKMLDRFLILGTSADTYYAGARKLTKDAAKAVEACIVEDGIRTVERIREVSVEGRAPKQEPAIFALALCAVHGNPETKRAALNAINDVCRTGTSLFTFIEYRNELGGWNRSIRNAIANWYNDKPADKLAYQMVKYRQRNGWAHKDALRLAHPKAVDEGHNALYQWAVGKGDGQGVKLIEVFNEVQGLKGTSKADIERACTLIRENRLPREALPTELLNSNPVWEALLEDMPMTAMVRNLATMTKNGLIATGSDAAKLVVAQLADTERLRKSRIHPIQLLSALRTYAGGTGIRGGSTWTPVSKVCDALDSAFYAAFKNVEPTGKRINISIDVSGSMTWGDIAGIPGLTPRDASAAIALVTANVEQDYEIYGFDHNYRPLDISPKRRLDDVIKYMNGLSFGSTDCSLPMTFSKKNNKKFDLFCVYTDNETNSMGSRHASTALKEYRSASGIDARLVVAGMTANQFSIADPSDGGMLDIVGFSTEAPQLIASFSKGEF